MTEVGCVEFAGFYAQICTIFIQILYRLFESYVHHVAADKLVILPTKMAASSVERC